jgi:hypothetical protein
VRDDEQRVQPRQIRNWVARDGTVYEVVLEPRMVLLGDSHERRRILTFTNRLVVNAMEKVRFVPEDFDLEATSDDALAVILGIR